MMKRRLIRRVMVGTGVLVLLGVAVLVILVHFRPGSLQDWIGSQLEDVANSYLNPKLSFTDLAYEYPLTVSLKNLHLTAENPGDPGHTIDIIACKQAVLSLGEIPSIGKPIVIQKIVLDQPLISAVAVEPGSKNFIGFSDLIRGGTNEPEKKTSEPPKKLSDVFQMRLVQLTDGKIVYDPRIPGTVPMTLDQINTALNIEPTATGWYKLDTVIARKPVFDLQLAGQLNLDSFSVRDADIKLLADLGQDKLDYLPPELQVLLKQYEAKGKLNVEVTGSMPVMDPMTGHVEAVVKLDRANIAMGGMHLPVDNLELDARFGDGKVVLPSLKIAALGGTIDLSGDVALNDRLDADLHLKVAGLVPEKLLANPAMMSPAPARLDLDFNLAASLMSVMGKAPAKPGEPLALIGLKNFRVSANDPANPGQRIDVVACKNLDVTLGEPIISGKPIVIDRIILDQPVLSAVSVAPGAMQFAGVPNLPAQAAPAPANSGAGPAAPEEPMQKPDDIVRVKAFQLNGAKIIYDPRLPGTQRMHLDDINTTLNLDPDHPGCYKLSTNISRKPVFNLAVDGEIDIDNPGLQNLNLSLQDDLTQNQLDFLPPQLQLILKQTRAKARLDVRVNASVAMSDPMKGKAQIAVNVQNIDLSQGGLSIPIDDFSMSASLQNGKVVQSMRIAALNSVFDISGSAMLNSRLDTDMTLKLKDIDIETVLGALNPSRPAPTTSTKLNAEVEIQAPIMVAMGAIRGGEGEPVATMNVRNLRLTTDDPLTPGQPLDFVSCDHFGVVLSSLPMPGSPIMLERVIVEHPALRAIAMAPQSKELAGFTALQNLAASQAPADSAAPTTLPTTLPAGPGLRLSDRFRMRTLSVADASLYYDPRLDGTVPMSLDHIIAKIDLDSEAGDAYRFDAAVPSKPDLNLEIAGRINVDTMIANPLTVDLTTEVGKDAQTYLPPQLQQILQPFNPEASVNVKVHGTVPLTDPTAADLAVDVKLDNVKATVGDYRIPLDHVRLPVQLKLPQVEFLDSSPLGGPTLEALGGTANLTGTVTLNDRLDSTVVLGVDGMLLQDLMATKITGPKKELIGALHMDLNLVNAPVLVVIAKATPPTTQPSAEASDPPSPLYTADLPANWGSADIELTHARLAGLELVQGISNIAKSAFADLFKHEDKNKPQTIVPKETATIVCTFNKDHISLSQIHYEGEVVEADGKGYITLDQHLNLDLTGGLIQKLGGLGSVGAWIKQASDSLLYYHVSGTFHNLNYKVKRGNGEPIVQGAKKITNEGVKAIDTGLNQTHKFFNKLFKKKDQDQSQGQDQGKN